MEAAVTGGEVACYAQSGVSCGCHCDVFTGTVICGNPAAGSWDFGCLHEHVRLGAGVCAEHEQYISSARGTCMECLEGPRSHDCESFLRAAGELVLRVHLPVVQCGGKPGPLDYPLPHITVRPGRREEKKLT
jgi:hypothetical protein